MDKRRLAVRLRRLTRRLNAAQVRHACKTALAALLSLAVTRLLHLEQGYWAAISTIIVMQSNIGGSLKAGWSRLLGTASGALLSVLAVQLLGAGPLALGLSVFLTILVCSYLIILHESFRMAGVTAAIVILLHREGESVALLAFNRFAEISLGILCALAVSFLIWPSQARQALRRGLAEALRQSAVLLDRLVACRLESAYEQRELFGRKEALIRLLTRNRELYSSSRREPGGGGASEELLAVMRHEERLFENLLAMDHAVRDASSGDSLHKLAADDLLVLVEAEERLMRRLADGLERKDEVDLGPELAALGAAQAAVDERLLALRREKAIAGFDLDEVIRFYSFLHAMREAARELQDAAPHVASMAGESPADQVAPQEA